MNSDDEDRNEEHQRIERVEGRRQEGREDAEVHRIAADPEEPVHVQADPLLRRSHPERLAHRQPAGKLQDESAYPEPDRRPPDPVGPRSHRKTQAPRLRHHRCPHGQDRVLARVEGTPVDRWIAIRVDVSPAHQRPPAKQDDQEHDGKERDGKRLDHG